MGPDQATPAEVSGAVGTALITPVAATRMVLANDQAVVPGALNNPDVVPVYPASLLPLHLPDETVCLGFVVGAGGEVSGQTAIVGQPGCPPTLAAVRPEFLAAAQSAVAAWDFYPYVRCTFPPGAPDSEKCTGKGASQEAVAVTLAYRFVFSVQSGSGSVQQAPVAP